MTNTTTGRATWSGTITFGLVALPVKLYLATGEADAVSFRQVHRDCGCRIQQRRFCTDPEHGEVAWGDLAKGYELGTDMIIELTDADLGALPLSTSKEIAVERFVDFDSIDPIYLTGSRTYYVGPGTGGEKSYRMLTEAMRESHKAGLVKVALRQRESLAVLRQEGDTLILSTLLWPAEVRTSTVAPKPAEMTVTESKQVDMAVALIDALSGSFDPDEYTDEYADAVRKMIEAKADGVTLPRLTESKATASDSVTDMLAESLAAVKAKRGAA